MKITFTETLLILRSVTITESFLRMIASIIRPSIRDQIDDQIVNSTCIKDMAIKKKDPTICSKGKKIDLTKRPDFKYSMKVYHDTCILKYAYEYSDPSVCKMIQHGNSIDPECLNSAGLKKKSAP
jgi:hypothetical protein